MYPVPSYFAAASLVARTLELTKQVYGFCVAAVGIFFSGALAHTKGVSFCQDMVRFACKRGKRRGDLRHRKPGRYVGNDVDANMQIARKVPVVCKNNCFVTMCRCTVSYNTWLVIGNTELSNGYVATGQTSRFSQCITKASPMHSMGMNTNTGILLY